MNLMPNLLLAGLGFHLYIANLVSAQSFSSSCASDGGDFLYQEDIAFRRRKRIIAFNTCPNHFSVCQLENCGGNVSYAVPSLSHIELPLYPSFALNTTFIANENTVVGVALNGVPIYVQSYGVNTSLVEGIDVCGGHTGEDSVYKYRNLPTCLLLQLANDSVNSHSPQIGWAYDGFPIYGPIGCKGVKMLPCGRPGAHPEVCLDECNGFYGEIRKVDDFKYRYYLPGTTGNGVCSTSTDFLGTCPRIDTPCCLNTLPDPTLYSPLTISCLKGCPINNPDCFNTNNRGVQSSFYPELSLFPNNTFTLPPPEEVVFSPNISSLPSFQNISSSNNTNISVATSFPFERATKVLIQLPFEPALAIVSSAASPSQLPSVESLPTSWKDAYITGIAVDSEGLLFTTGFGLYSMPPSGDGVVSCLISGYVSIIIKGVYLGRVATDVLSITVGSRQPQSCSSITYINAQELQCTLVLQQNRFTELDFMDDEAELLAALDIVSVTTTGGTTTSPLLTAATINNQQPPAYSFDDILSLSNRPVIIMAVAGGNLTAPIVSPFVPFAIAIRNPLLYGSPASRVIYISNLAGNEILVLDNQEPPNIYSVLQSVQKVYSMAILPVSQLSASALETLSLFTSLLPFEILFYVDAVRGMVCLTVLPAQLGEGTQASEEYVLLKDVPRLKSLAIEANDAYRG